MQKHVVISLVSVAVLVTTIISACSPRKTLLEQVLSTGELRAITRNASTTYYRGPHGPTGMEYDLLQKFANYLDVKLHIVATDDLKDILEQVSNGDVQVAAAGLTITEERKQKVRFTPAYQQITQQLVFHAKGNKPHNLQDISLGSLEVVANSSHAERLNEIKSTWRNLNWEENNTAGINDLINLVAEQVIDYTIADSNEIALNRRYHPQLKVAFDISPPQQLAWAFSKGEDDSLYNKAVTFFNNLKASGELDSMIKRHYGHVNNYDYAGTFTYMHHIRKRLPTYRQLFQDAAEFTDLDWTLLAAMAYQESHWNPRAKSPTGVRGMMMLTKTTAKQLGVVSRTDARQSIRGGARYFRSLLGRFPSQIQEPDRTWLALAAYNVGYGHVKDAMLITEERGGNPNKWSDVKESLPLLRLRKWYKKTRYGYARGHEPVRYVENIRSYRDILRWLDNRGLPVEDTLPESLLAYASPVL